MENENKNRELTPEQLANVVGGITFAGGMTYEQAIEQALPLHFIQAGPKTEQEKETDRRCPYCQEANCVTDGNYHRCPNCGWGF